MVFGVLRGCGRQRLGAIANLTIIWGLGMPLAGILTFKLGMGILGLWLDQLGISVAMAVVLLTCLSRFSWHEEAEKAHDRLLVAHGKALLKAAEPPAAAPDSIADKIGGKLPAGKAQLPQRGGSTIGTSIADV